MASKSTSGKDKAKRQPVISANKQKTRNSNATLDGLAVKSAAKRTRKEAKSIVDTDQSASKPSAKRTQKEAKSIVDTDEQSASKPTAKRTRKEAKSIVDTDEQSASKHAAKRTRKVLNKKEKQGLCSFLNAVDISVLVYATRSKLNEQSLTESLKHFVDKLFKNEPLLQCILVHHRERFVELFAGCQKGADSFLRFQLQWHHHCSAFLLSKEYSLSVINLEKSVKTSVASLRAQWLDFCEDHCISIDDSKKVMIPISSSVYELLLERSNDFQSSLDATSTSSESTQLPTSLVDGDDVYLRFGGAALCDMLHQRYKQIKGCPETQRNVLSQEITILQAINMKDKSKLPQYLMYRDNGYMYFPDVTFIPFLRDLDEVVKGVINTDTIQDDDQIIKVI